MHRFAILGASGYIGTEFVRQVRARDHEAIVSDSASYRSYNVDALAASLADVSPDFVINCAGYTGKPNVDACESDKALCLAANAVLPGIVSESCLRLGLRWGHLSSGCIYAGCRPDGGGFRETDAANFTFRQNNCSFYSGSKALGEEIIERDANCYVWRPRIPFSNVDSPRNYLTKLLRYDRLLNVDNSLSCLHECVAACLDCFEKELIPGVYNLTNPGAICAAEVVEMMRAGGITDKSFEFFASEAEFMESEAIAPRSNCILDCTKAIEAGLKLTDVRESLATAIRDWRKAT